MKTVMTQLMTAVLLTASLEATAAKHTISAADFSFSPAALTVSLGDTIEWVHANGSHTTTSQMIPPGAAAWDAPLDTANPSFIYVPSEPGNYSYICVPHQSMGMAGSFTVLGPTSVKQPGTLSLRLAPNPASTEVWIELAETDLTVVVTDASGRVTELPQTGESGYRKSYSVAGLAAGLYLVLVRTEERTATGRLVISR